MSATPRPWHVIVPTPEGQEHLPPFPKDMSMRHLGIGAGEITPVATVWNHHHHHECIDNTELIVRAVNAFDALLAVAKAAEAPIGYVKKWTDHDVEFPMLQEAIKALDAAHPDWRTW